MTRIRCRFSHGIVRINDININIININININNNINEIAIDLKTPIAILLAS